MEILTSAEGLRVWPYVLLICVLAPGCVPHNGSVREASPIAYVNREPAIDPGDAYGKGALLLTRFKSLEELKSVVDFEYSGENAGKQQVCLTHHSRGRTAIAVLQTGVSEQDFMRARDGGFWERVRLVLKCPRILVYKADMLRVEMLSRRRYLTFGEGDIAFYDLAETMVEHIRESDLTAVRSEDLSEKGYLNTFNHVTAQAFITSLYSEELADFIADAHERYHIPELITGVFAVAQVQDLENGPVDNYIDIINNEWGQELGKRLKAKYHIDRKTYWTTGLLASYLNDIQSYHSWAFGIGFDPFRPGDEKVMRFAGKINKFRFDVSDLRNQYR